MLRSIGHSAFAIVLVQGINFLMPLAALPHISRAFGIHGFGLYAIVISYGNYVLMVSDFSFNVNGPLLVAQAKRETRLRALVYDSHLVKMILIVPALLAFGIAAWFATDGDVPVILAGAAIPLMTTLTPRWIMYSVDAIYTFAAASLVTKGAWLAATILFVDDRGDVARLLWITAISQGALALACLVVVLARAEPAPARPSLARSVALLRRDLNQFAALVTTSSLRDLGVVMLSATTGAAGVSVYALADRVRFAVMGVISPVSQSLFLVTARHGTGDGGVRQRVRGITNMAILTVAATCGLGICVLAGPVVSLLGGAQFAGATPLLRIVALAPVFTALNSIIGVNTLLAEGYAAQYAAAQLRAVALAAPSMAVLVLTLGPLGAAIGVLATEIYMSAMLTLACRRAGIMRKSFALA